ncbi:hypothetical protein ACQ4PT_025792 [Festuca glaucescens]
MVSSCLASPAAARGGSALRLQQQPRACRVTCLADSGGTRSRAKAAGGFACGLLAAWAVASAPGPVIAAGQRLPPLSTDPKRCEAAFVGNTIALMSDAKFDGADMTEVVMSKAYAVGASFKGTDFTNAVIDRAVFSKADLEVCNLQEHPSCQDQPSRMLI